MIENLLTRLEEVSAEAVRVTDPALDTPEKAGNIEELIRERGVLIGQLHQELAGATGRLGYSEFNRLVVIHYQGTRIHANLQARRSVIALKLMENSRERAFLDCVSGVVASPPAPRIINNA